MTGKRRSPHGERGLKLLFQIALGLGRHRRSPHGERGLKFLDPVRILAAKAVAPLTGSVD